MKKRLIALVLALSMALSLLSGCGKKQSAAPEQASGGTPLSLRETVSAMRKLEDYAVDLTVSRVDEEGKAGEMLYTAKGALYESKHQGKLTFTGTDGGAVTEIFIDGSNVILNANQFLDFLKREYSKAEDAEDLGEDIEALEELKETFGEYVTVPLKEDIWLTLRGDTTAKVRSLMSSVWESICKEVEKKATEDKSAVTTLVAGPDLQKQLLKVYGSLGMEEDYRVTFRQYLEDNFAALEDACGWDSEGLTESIWMDYGDKEAELQALEAENSWNEWKYETRSWGSDEEGYTLDVTRVTDDSRHFLLTLTPEAAADIEMPEETADYNLLMDDSAYVYYVFRNVKERILGTDDDYMDEDEIGGFDMEELEEMEGMDGMNMELDKTPVAGTKYLSTVPAATEDGYEATVPVLSEYTAAECVYFEGESGPSTDIYAASDGYALEWYSIDATTRTPAEIVEETTEAYVSIYGEEFGYPILTEQTKTNVSADKKCAVSAFAYRDSDENEDYTMLNIAVKVEGSEFALCAQLDVINANITNREISGIEELLTYLGLENPIALKKAQ